jgi:S1-C subfamily serine protease
MTDEPLVPMSDEPDPAGEPTQPSAVAPETQPLPEQAPAAPQPPPAPAAPSWSNSGTQSWPPQSGWGASPTWGSAPQGWPPPPVTPPAPEAATAVQPPGSVPPPVGPPAGPGTWGYGYGPPGWGTPPPAKQPSKLARIIVVGVAVVALAIASGGVGAAISSAVHSNDNSAATFSPNTGNGFGNGNFPFGNGTGNGTGNGNGSGNGSNNGAVPSSITDKVNPAVVDIFTTIDTGSSTGEAAGTGMILTSDGEVLTNNHVIDGATSVKVELVGTGETHTAEVLGFSVVDDVALLKIDGVSNLDTIDTADASSVNVNDSVFAIGNAGGRGGTPAATSGKVTALDQKVTAGDSGTGDSETLHGMIQISARIEPGDSGGPLVDSDGNIIGMNTAAAQNDSFLGGGGSTTAFAIPIDKAIQIVDQVRNGQNSDTVHVGDRAILGVQVRNPGAFGSSTTTSGAAVVGTKDGSPADAAGIGAGDVITTVDGKTVQSASDLTSLMFGYHPGDKVDLTWVDQNGGTHSGTLTLVAGPPN